MIRTLKRYLKKAFRWLFRGRRSTVRTWVITYLLALMPANYVTTALTTASSLSNPAQVIRVMSNTEAFSSFTGVLNTATGGLLKPTYNGLVAAFGSAAQAAGSALGNHDLAEKGKDMIDSSKQWFNAGQEALSDLNAKSTGFVDELKKMFGSDMHAAAIAGNVTVEPDFTYAWNENIAPDYYRVVGYADTSDQTLYNIGEYFYSELDALGRSGRAEAVIGIDAIMKSAGVREEFEKGSDPSGWGHNRKVSVVMTNGRVYNGYAWNRSHMIADSLGGRAFRNNLITGTRMQNVGANDSKGGMQYIERKVLDYIKDNPDVTVWYEVTPIYEGENLVPIAVLVNAVSSDGSINEQVVTYNTLPGYEINYATGQIFKK